GPVVGPGVLVLRPAPVRSAGSAPASERVVGVAVGTERPGFLDPAEGAGVHGAVLSSTAVAAVLGRVEQAAAALLPAVVLLLDPVVVGVDDVLVLLRVQGAGGTAAACGLPGGTFGLLRDIAAGVPQILATGRVLVGAVATGTALGQSAEAVRAFSVLLVVPGVGLVRGRGGGEGRLRLREGVRCARGEFRAG